jgi:hypothetical protein
MNRDIRASLSVTLTLFAVAFAVSSGMEACTPHRFDDTAATAAESAYTADLLRCVDKAATLAESRACREVVDAKWGITHVRTKDGGR